MKSKLGISVGLLGAATYFLGLFSGYLVLALLVGYILLCEDNEWLRKSAVKALALLLCFSVVSAVIGFIPDVISIVVSAGAIFDKMISVPVVNKIVTFIQLIIVFIKEILMLVLGFKALSQRTIKIGFIDNLINKHM